MLIRPEFWELDFEGLFGGGTELPEIPAESFEEILYLLLSSGRRGVETVPSASGEPVSEPPSEPVTPTRGLPLRSAILSSLTENVETDVPAVERTFRTDDAGEELPRHPPIRAGVAVPAAADAGAEGIPSPAEVEREDGRPVQHVFRESIQLPDVEGEPVPAPQDASAVSVRKDAELRPRGNAGGEETPVEHPPRPAVRAGVRVPDPPPQAREAGDAETEAGDADRRRFVRQDPPHTPEEVPRSGSVLRSPGPETAGGDKPPYADLRKPADRGPTPPAGERSLPADPPSFEGDSGSEERSSHEREVRRFTPSQRSGTEIRDVRIEIPLTERSDQRTVRDTRYTTEEPLFRKEPYHFNPSRDESTEIESQPLERRELPTAPQRQEVRRIDLRLESAHMRFRFQNENLSVEINIRERIENHITYMDAQRLYRNLQALGVNLEILRINGTDLSPKGWKVSRREERERGNIGEDGDPRPKAAGSAPDSADLNLLL